MPITFAVVETNKLEKVAVHERGGEKKIEKIASSPAPTEGTECRVNNGFVDAVCRAYNQHHHLILRPDDVWLAIVFQFCLFMEKYAEELRDKFVNHKGQVELVSRAAGSLFSAPYEYLADMMTKEIAKNIKDPSVREWVMPSFSTTTRTDSMIGAIALMSAMKAYFSYKFELCCGIPKVTLEGTPEDWANIEARAARLVEFDNNDKMLTKWYAMLKDVLANFTQSAKGSPDLLWWNRVCSHHGGGSGPRYLSGWITVFCVFSDTGVWLGDSLSNPDDRSRFRMANEDSKAPKEEATGAKEGWPFINTNDIPHGKCKAPVLVDDNGTKYDCELVAGHMSMIANDTSIAPCLSWHLKLADKKDKPTDPLHAMMEEFE